MSSGNVGRGWGGGMDGEPGAGPPGTGRDLQLVAAGVAGLRALAADPDASGDSARVYDFGIRWGTLLAGRLKRLEHYHRAGELTREQERLYRDLRRELGEVAPLATRLGLAQPPAPPEARAFDGPKEWG